MRARARLPLLALGLVLGLCSSCSSWKPRVETPDWTLYSRAQEPVDEARYARVLAAAHAAVEESMGPFRRPVRVHAFRGAVELTGDGRRVVASTGGVQEVDGIGPARIEGYHARGGGPFSDQGVFLGGPEAGTATHELVHARLAEEPDRVPLWFEEGVATYLGDGVLTARADGSPRWVVDGLACWPWNELRANPVTDDELARLLTLGSNETDSVRDNVLVHFVGWALVFDLARDTGSGNWRDWQAAFDWEQPLPDARERLERTLHARTPAAWMERLLDPDPGVRLATAKGTWKLREPAVATALLEALEAERDDEVRVALAVNLLAGAGELELDALSTWRVRRAAATALRDARLPDPDEAEAVATLLSTFRKDSLSAQDALERLSRFWRE